MDQPVTAQLADAYSRVLQNGKLQLSKLWFYVWQEENNVPSKINYAFGGWGGGTEAFKIWYQYLT